MSLFREEVSEYRKTRLHGEVVLSQPLSTRLMVAVLFAIIAIIALWLALGTYARIETVPGVLSTDTPSSKVVATIAGVVTELNASEGQLVKKGDSLAVINLDRQASTGENIGGISLNTVDMRAELAKTQLGLSVKRLASERDRLQSIASAAEQQSDSLRTQISLQENVVSSNQTIHDQIAAVVGRGFISKVEFERRRQALIGSKQALANLQQELLSRMAEAHQARAQIASLTVELAQNVSEIKSNLQAIAQQRAQIAGEQGYIISAPISGRVTALQIAKGRIAQPAIPLMVIVPEGSELKAELYAPTRAIGFVHKGQEARILYDAFPYTRFGSFGGKIETISRSAIDPRESDAPIKLEEPVYRITVTLDRQTLSAYGKSIELQPGMTLRANIVLERQTFLQWLLQPLNAVLKRTT